MSYAVELAPEALEDLARLPPPAQNFLEQSLRRLAADPVALSRPSIFPFAPSPMYEVDTVLDGTHYFFTILFRYGQDETHLQVLAIAMSRIG